MADPQDFHGHDRVVDGIDDPVVTRADSVERSLGPAQPHGGSRSGILSQRIDRRDDPASHALVAATDGSKNHCRPRGEDDPIGQLLESEFRLQIREGNTLVALSEGFSGQLDVDPIFQEFEQFEIFG